MAWYRTESEDRALRHTRDTLHTRPVLSNSSTRSRTGYTLYHSCITGSISHTSPRPAPPERRPDSTVHAGTLVSCVACADFTSRLRLDLCLGLEPRRLRWCTSLHLSWFHLVPQAVDAGRQGTQLAHSEMPRDCAAHRPHAASLRSLCIVWSLCIVVGNFTFAL